MNTTNTSYSSTSLTATSSMRRQGTVMAGQVTLPSTSSSSSSALSLLHHIDSLSTELPCSIYFLLNSSVLLFYLSSTNCTFLVLASSTVLVFPSSSLNQLLPGTI